MIFLFDVQLRNKYDDDDDTPNLNRIPCATEDEFVDADVNHEIGHLSQEYRQWRRQTVYKVYIVRLLSLKPSLKLKLI